MKKTTFLLFSFPVLFFNTTLFADIDVNPQPGQNVWTILDKVGEISDLITPIAIDNTTSPYTISNSGNYQLIENKDGQIIIDVDDVYLNLNTYGITHNNATEHVISINSDKKNIKISNGWIANSAGPGTGSGILINTGASKIMLENLEVLTSGHGISLSGQDGSEVMDCKIVSCDFIENNTAISLYYADNNFINTCRSIDGEKAGYELYHSSDNVIADCHAINTHGNESAIAFYSNSGSDNLFNDCVAKTTKTSATLFGNAAYGFKLTGTETKTKIINCIVNDTDMIATASALGYGIHLAPVLHDNSNLLIQLDNIIPQGSTGSLNALAWSPSSHQIVTGGAGGKIAIMEYNGTNIIDIDSRFGGMGIINSISWSPNGRYIAVGDDGTYGIIIFQFTNNAPYKYYTYDPGVSILSLAWSPNGKYLAVGDDGNNLRVFAFDDLKLIQIDTDNIAGADVTSVSWSPDGRYIATADAGNYVRVFSFDGNVLTHRAGNNTAGAVVNSVAWSPNSGFIAAGDANGYVRVFGFDSFEIFSTYYLFHIDGYDAAIGGTNSVAWSPDGNYIASGDNDKYVHVFKFDGQNLVSIKYINPQGVNVSDVAWSPDGKYICSIESLQFTLLNAMYGPENCLVQDNCVCDTNTYGQYVSTSTRIIGQFAGTGIAGSIANNSIILNTSCNNTVNYSFGIPNVYDMYLTDSHLQADASDNISFSSPDTGIILLGAQQFQMA